MKTWMKLELTAVILAVSALIIVAYDYQSNVRSYTSLTFLVALPLVIIAVCLFGVTIARRIKKK